MAEGLSNKILMPLIAVGGKVGIVASILQGSMRGLQYLRPT